MWTLCTVLPSTYTGACENGWLVIHMPACIPDLHNKHSNKHSSNSLEGEGDNSNNRKKTGKLLLGPERRQRLREERHEVIQQGDYLQTYI
jgi:hypothetical protein